MQGIRPIKYRVLPPLIYPTTMLCCLALFFAFQAQALPLWVCSYVPVTFGAGIIAFFERYTPHLDQWLATKTDVWNDALFMVTVQMALPKILTFLVVITLLQLIEKTTLPTQALWPHHWPIGIQALLMVLSADFLRYWLHRFSHQLTPLWRLHAVHHSPPKLYWINVARFHPFEKAVQFLFDAMPFILLGVGSEVLALYFVFYAVNGFFQHCNIELHFGPLNYLISSAELHRWHHSRKVQESNANYGNNIIIWDLLFGTYFFPKDRQVEEIGLVNKDYPLGYATQLKTPFLGRIDQYMMPLQSVVDIILNVLLKIRMNKIKRSDYQRLIQAAQDPSKAQVDTLLSIVHANRNTHFGRSHNFAAIDDCSSFMQNVPVHTYEDLRPQINAQGQHREPVLTAAMPVMYNQTSGTTGKPKYIPVLQQNLDALKRSQHIFSYMQYRARPEAFHGKLLGLVSPAIDGYLENGIPYGSASGHIYKTMPKIARAKYVLPIEVFEITDYDSKYYIIALLSLAEENITYFGTANPSTCHRLLEVINQQLVTLLQELATGTCNCFDALPTAQAAALRQHLRPNPTRADQLRQLAQTTGTLAFSDVWPYLQVLTTWTGGSCGISLAGILPYFPANIQVIELGYLASELRGTITIDANANTGIPTLDENFFEFVEKTAWENGTPEFIGIEALQQGAEYYLFVTTSAGLYRYDMNDIVEVTGRFANTPTIRFLQKGKGVTNLTGEKLYESQIIDAVHRAEIEFQLKPMFYQVLANQQDMHYECYIELATSTRIEPEQIAAYLDRRLQELNMEYEAKRSSGRLHSLILYTLKNGTYEHYKKHCLAEGQREGQFKTLPLQYRHDFRFDLAPYIE